jgi:hypothetical protein
MASRKGTTIKLNGDAANVFLKIQTDKASVEETLAIGIYTLVAEGNVAMAVKSLKEYKECKTQ